MLNIRGYPRTKNIDVKLSIQSTIRNTVWELWRAHDSNSVGAEDTTWLCTRTRYLKMAIMNYTGLDIVSISLGRK